MNNTIYIATLNLRVTRQLCLSRVVSFLPTGIATLNSVFFRSNFFQHFDKLVKPSNSRFNSSCLFSKWFA